MAKTTPTPTDATSVRAFADRLILEQITEMESVVKLSELVERLSDKGFGLSSLRALLASNPELFAFSDRRWIPASRLQAEGRPVRAAIALVLSRFGAPMPVRLLVAEIALSRSEDVEHVRPIVERILRNDPAFALSPGGLAGLAAFGFVAVDERPARALALNGVTAEEVAALSEKLGPLDFREPGSVGTAVEKLAPVKLRTLGALVYTRLTPDDPKAYLMYDAKAFLAEVTDLPGYVLDGTGVLAPASQAPSWIAAAVRMSDNLVATTDLDDAAPLEIKTEDIDALIAKILGRDGTTTGSRLLEENYEITTSSKSYGDDLKTLRETLAADARVAWVGGDRFRKAGDLPDDVGVVPEPFVPAKSDLVSEEGDPVDAELTDEGLSGSLKKLLSHPLAMDVLDEEIQPAPKTMPEQVRLVLKSLHRELGTFPLSQIPTGWLDADPKVQELLVIDPDGRELPIMFSHDSRLMQGWIDWWYEQPVESGAVFTLTKTKRPNVLDFAWLDGSDPVVHIDSDRMEELRALGAEAEGRSTFDLVCTVMSHWPKGADFLTILAEVNVVRRSSRRLVASILSFYNAFSQRSGSPVWHFDAKKVEEGVDKSKRKFVRK